MSMTSAALITVATWLVTVMPAYAEESNWTDRIDFSGDFRLRYEMIDEDLVSMEFLTGDR